MEVPLQLMDAGLSYLAWFFCLIPYIRMNYNRIFSKFYDKLLTDPKQIYLYGKALLRGCAYVAYFRLFRKNVRIKLPFYLFYKFKIVGPGSVFIDADCQVHSNTREGLTIVTLHPDAQVLIGRKCFFGGVTIRCTKRVEIEEGGLFAYGLIQDTLFSVARPVKNCETDVDLPSAISIDKDVWIASNTIILGGSQIGKAAVLSIGSVCHNFAIPEGHLSAGNPVRQSVNVKGIDKTLRNQ